ncbi:hypothetical protein O1611_g7815 [Lasiodiplodia mahajangana]|uniref:Uncharacterized protein n=1 Tax=Lasiodiplodia mahajangana TaxID=1108764 RepID=A0ACC2JE63_9PEZI|nr:hypothetical protein O1611_g7815 [Lasiodiplodia mahajangana]
MDTSNTAYLQTLNLAKLASKDADELAKLLDACQNQGFFYLDPSSYEAAKPLEDRVKALSFTKEWFDRPMEEKMKIRQDSVTKGYKPIGTLSGVVKNKKDGFENIKMPRDDFINGNNTLPDGLNTHLDIFQRDLELSHAVTILILSCLSDLLKPSRPFEDYHRGTMASQSTMMYFRYAKQHDQTAGVGHNMHTDTSSIFFTVLTRQSWIPIQDRVRLVEWKGRMDLAWYAVSGSAPLDSSAITSYSNPESDNMGWSELFDAVIKERDDGHAAKFIRALRNGQDVCEKFEAQSEWAGYFPARGDMWLKIARMCHDTTKNLPLDLKWVHFTGFEQPWKRPHLAS